MSAMSQWLRKLWLLVRRGRFRSELDEEMAFHRAQAEEDMVDRGMKPEEARRARQLGNAARLQLALRMKKETPQLFGRPGENMTGLDAAG